MLLFVFLQNTTWGQSIGKVDSPATVSPNQIEAIWKLAQDLYAHHNYQEAIPLLHFLHNNHVVEASVLLGDAYYLEKGAYLNDDSAYFYYHHAASYNHPYALFMMSMLHTYGHGTTIDAQQALHYYQAACAAQYPAAIAIQQLADSGLILGQAYYDQAMQASTEAEQYTLLTQAALRYHRPAIIALLQHGDSLGNAIDTYFWAVLGTYIMDDTALYYLQSIDTADRYTLSDANIYKIYHLATLSAKIADYYATQGMTAYEIRWYEIAAHYNPVKYYEALGKLYATHRRFKDKEKAIMYLNKAIALGSKTAATMLSNIQ